MAMTETGIYVHAKVLNVFEREDTDRNGKPYTRHSIQVAFVNTESGDHEVPDKQYIGLVPHAAKPDVEVGGYYTFACALAGGKDRKYYLTLRSDKAIDPAQAA